MRPPEALAHTSAKDLSEMPLSPMASSRPPIVAADSHSKQARRAMASHASAKQRSVHLVQPNHWASLPYVIFLMLLAKNVFQAIQIAREPHLTYGTEPNLLTVRTYSLRWLAPF